MRVGLVTSHSVPFLVVVCRCPLVCSLNYTHNFFLLVFAGQLHAEGAALRRLPGPSAVHPFQGLRLPRDFGGILCVW